MLRFAPLVSVLCLLVACAAEPPEEEALPLPPPTPPRVQRAAPAPRAQPVPNGDSVAVAAATAAITPSSETPAPPAAVAPAAPAPPAWRVARDGVVGCADRATLAVLNQAAEGAPRLLAEARASGGCRTTFRVNEWVAEASEGDVVRLRMTNGGPLTLWFRRAEVVAP